MSRWFLATRQGTSFIMLQVEAREASAALHDAQKQAAGPSAAALRLELASLQQQLLEANEEAAAANAAAAEFEREVATLPAAIVAKRERAAAAAGDVLREMHEQARATLEVALCVFALLLP
jgi:hypothetical protein